MMNRRNIIGWLAGLLGAGAASGQVLTQPDKPKPGDIFRLTGAGVLQKLDDPAKRCVGIDNEPVACDPIGWKNYKATNNQCPVCGTMAPAMLKRADWLKNQAPPYCMIWDKKRGAGYYRSCTIDDAPKQNLVRCAKCNAAFYQAAE